MAQLDTSSGRPQRTTPNDAWFEEYLYGQRGEGGWDITLEATLLYIQHQMGHSRLSSTARYAKYMDEDPYGEQSKARLRAMVENLWQDGRK